MHFVLISKKESFKNKQINVNLLNSPNAPSLISREAIKFQISDFILYIYPYNHIDNEVYDYSYYNSDDKLLLINGLVNINNNLRNSDIQEFFHRLNDSTNIFGDYQLVSIDEDGNGFLKTPLISKRQLFFYEDENCTVFSTEIKLIVDGIQKFREDNFVHHFDLDFIEDCLFREWTTRYVPRNTIFKEIKRILPQDVKYFREGRIVIEEKESIKIPKWFKNHFNNDKNGLYDDYYKFLLNFAEINLVRLKPNIKKIILGLTGGFDSRLNIAILSKICKKHQIPLVCYTYGQETHPDAFIAKKIAKILDIQHFHHLPLNNCFPNTKEYNDYVLTFYMAQGDFNSKDFVPYYDRNLSTRLSPLTNDTVAPAIGAYPVNESEIYQLGNDGYKRININKLNIANTWSARRILFSQNFILPLFFTAYELWFALTYGKMEHDAYKEFVYEILKRSEPKLLDVPVVGHYLPPVNVEPYLGWLDSKHHEKEPFLWDYEFVRNKLKPLLREKFNRLNENEKSYFELAGLNQLDYFVNEKLHNIIHSYQENETNRREFFKALLKERISRTYPRNKSMVSLSKDLWKDSYVSRLQILMDFASVANKRSFEEIESELMLN